MPAAQRSPIGPLLVRVAAATKATILILALTLVLIAGLELAYRGQVAVRAAFREEPRLAAFADLHPNAGESWWREFHRVPVTGGGIRYDPYRGWWPLHQSSPFINVDSLGLRRTVQPEPPPGAPTVLFLGGSVMWGYIVRDEFTIPSLVAARMAERGRPIRAVNLAQSMFQLTQETATLILQIRDGPAPAAAVFLDGNNEIASAFRSGQPGRILNEELLARRFAAGRTGFWGHQARAFGELELVKRLTRSERPLAAGDSTVCGDIAGRYARMARTASALAREHGVATVFFWQPMLATSGKRLGPWERRLSAPAGWTYMARECARLAEAAMDSLDRVRFVQLRGVFDAETTDVFIDHFGHLTERAGSILSERIASVLDSLLSAGRP